MDNIHIIIPARYGSKRLPGKPLVDIAGKPMITHVLARAMQVPGVSSVVVATDHDEIARVVEREGGRAVITRPSHPSGTDRIYEACKLLEIPSKDIVVNVQGDQPLVEVSAIEGMVQLFVSRTNIDMATVACPMDHSSAIDPNRVKVVLDREGLALYFSRSLIPYDRDRLLEGRPRPYLRHLGLYCYRVSFLKKFVSWPRGRLEGLEKLEQLRVLENGGKIGVFLVEKAPPEVDTQEDLRLVEEILATEL